MRKTHKPIDIETIYNYLRQYGAQVEIMVMDLNPTFKATVRKTLDRPLIIADGFHYSRYIHWA